MYLKSDVARYRSSYLASVDELRRAVPESGDMIDAVDQQISEGALYKALKEIRKLIRREEELVAV
jgi:flagellar protein FlbT